MLDISQMDLRALARAYSGGLLDFEQYRRARAQLLDRVTGDATIMVQPHSRSMEHGPKPAMTDEGMTKRGSYRLVLYWSLMMSVVLLILAFWLFNG